jgi:hypothetical protein
MKFIMNTVLVFIVVSHVGLCLAVVKAASARKSTPPVKITDPNDIKYREDICYGRGNYPEPHQRISSVAIR